MKMDIYTTLLPFLKIIETAVVIVLTYVSIRICSYFINHLKVFNKNLTAIYALRDLVKYIIILIAIIVIFNIFGIDLKGIFISIGIVSIAVSFAAKDIISNLMSGFFLITDKTIEVGDMMQVNSLKGEVKEIGLRNTTILTEAGDTVYIPNSTLSTTPYSRFKKHELEKVSLVISVPLDVDISEFKKEVLEMIGSYDEISKTPAPLAESHGIDEGYSQIKIQFWVKTFNKKEDYKLIITNQIRKIINEKQGDDN